MAARPCATVTALSTTPVKGLHLNAVEELELQRDGAAGNRRFYLVDDRGRMVNGKRAGILGAVQADYDDAAQTLALSFPDGSQVAAPVRHGETIETSFFSQPRPARPLLGPFAQALSDYAGIALTLVQADQSAVDRGPAGAVSLISRASVEQLESVADGERVDPRRFRMLIEVDGAGAHEEDGWVGRSARVGGALVTFHGHVGRCLVTQQNPDSGVADLPTLELLDYRRGLPTTEPLAFGVYGEVIQAGAVALGDELTLIY